MCPERSEETINRLRYSYQSRLSVPHIARPSPTFQYSCEILDVGYHSRMSRLYTCNNCDRICSAVSLVPTTLIVSLTSESSRSSQVFRPHNLRVLDPRTATLCYGMDALPRLRALLREDTLEDVEHDLVRPVSDAVDVLRRLLSS